MQIDFKKILIIYFLMVAMSAIYYLFIFKN
jgi:hypothetical protein